MPALSLAQTIPGGFRIDVLGVASPSNPSVTIRVSAWWEPHPAYKWFDQGWFDFASAGGEFSNAVVLPVYTRRIPSPASRPGVLAGSVVRDVYLDQFFQPHLSLIPLPDNPLALWEVTWTTDEFTPRRVRVGTGGREGIHVLTSGTPPIPRLEYVPGSAFIRVVPAPATAMALLGLGQSLFTQRRRPA